MINKFYKIKIFGDVGQWISLILNLTGLICLIILKTEYGSILLVAGSLALTISTKIKYYGQKRYNELKCNKRRKSLKISNF